MDDHEEAAAAARDTAALAEAPEDPHMVVPPCMPTSVEPPLRLVRSASTSSMQVQRPRASRTNCGAIARTWHHSARTIAEVVGVLVVKQSVVLLVAVECLPAQSAVWLRHGGHYEDNHTTSTTPASMCLMPPSRHLIVPWFKCRGLFERTPG